jgi:hypothetical protein
MSIKCGNPKHGGVDIRHESVADVRACFSSPNGVADFAPSTEGIQFPVSERFATESLAEINADQETWPWSYRKGKDKHAFDLGRRYAETAAEIGVEVTAWDEPLRPIASSPFSPVESPRQQEVWAEFQERPAQKHSGYAATEAQISFIKVLLSERDWETGLDNDPIAQRVLDGLPILKTDASSLIPALKALPKRDHKPETHRTVEQPWRELSREVPAGNYKITDPEGKNHFYRVSVGSQGFYKIQERASEELFFIPLVRYAGILQSILDAGTEAARLAYAKDQTRCWHCNTRLTDNTGNPHYVRGLGPKCGEEN